MRLPNPDLSIREQIHQTGLALINLFALDLFEIIDSDLKTSLDADWLLNYRKSQLKYASYNFLDPGNLLKEIIRVSASPLRQPLRNRIPQRDNVAFYSRLDVILDDRNDWIHHNIAFNKDSLKTLVLNLYPICSKLHLALLKECDFVLSLLSENGKSLVPNGQLYSEVIEQTHESNEVSLIREFIPPDEMSIGTAIEDELLIKSYTLHKSGEVRDRETNQLLSDIKPESSKTIGTLLIARKPSGGRLRITPQGVIVAYFEDHWGYLATVSPETWFPEHIW